MRIRAMWVYDGFWINILYYSRALTDYVTILLHRVLFLRGYMYMDVS